MKKHERDYTDRNIKNSLVKSQVQVSAPKVAQLSALSPGLKLKLSPNQKTEMKYHIESNHERNKNEKRHTNELKVVQLSTPSPELEVKMKLHIESNHEIRNLKNSLVKSQVQVSMPKVVQLSTRSPGSKVKLKYHIESNHETTAEICNIHHVGSKQGGVRRQYNLSNGKVKAVQHLKCHIESKHEETRQSRSQCETCSYKLEKVIRSKYHTTNRHERVGPTCYQCDFTYRCRTLSGHKKRQQQQQERGTAPPKLSPPLE